MLEGLVQSCQGLVGGVEWVLVGFHGEKNGVPVSAW